MVASGENGHVIGGKIVIRDRIQEQREATAVSQEDEMGEAGPFFKAQLKNLLFGLTPKTVHSGIVSFCFDDAPKSAWYRGGRVLREFGFRGTYFIATGLTGMIVEPYEEQLMTWKEIQSAYEAGFEIASHTRTHETLDTCSSRAVRRELEGALKDINISLGLAATKLGFAYPNGRISKRKNLEIIRRYSFYARGIDRSLNRWPFSVWNLKCFPLYECRRKDYDYEMILRETIATRSWVIFVTHDISENPTPYGCTPAYFREIVQTVSRLSLNVYQIKKVITETVEGLSLVRRLFWRTLQLWRI